MVDILVDTSILVDLLRNYPPAAIWVSANQNLRLGITPIVWMELVRGVPDKSAQTQAINLLSIFKMTYLSQEDMGWAMQQLQTYHLSHGIGMNDCLIASPAHRLQLPLITRNMKHFSPLLGTLTQKPY